MRLLDGPLAPISCVSQMAYEPCGCPDEATCGLRMVMGDVRNAIAGILDNTTLADVTRRADVDRLRDEALRAFGRVDVWVNNAGVSFITPFLECTRETWDLTQRVNLHLALGGNFES